MTRNQLYNKMKAEAIKLAEEELSSTYGKGGLDWHPYYARIRALGESGEGKGLRMTLVVRDGELEYFRRKKKKMPDFETPALHALEKTVQKYHPELVMVELIDNFNKTEDVEATWQQ